MKKTLTAIVILIFASSAIVHADEPQYSIEPLVGIMQELQKEQYKEPIKEWLKENRPKQYQSLFGEPATEAEEETDDKDRSILSILADLNAAIADPQIAMLDYYINSKTEQGWEVVSMTQTLILFRKHENTNLDSNRK